MTSTCRQAKSLSGFTLAELLIALAILGVIVSFTIPKIITAQQNGKYNAAAKEAAATIAAAYSIYQSQNTITSNTSASNLTPYMNYVVADTSSTIDLYQGDTTRACNGTNYFCVKLHNGGMLLWASAGFMGTTPKNAIYFYFDPDGRVTDGTTNGPGKSVVFWLYTTGKLTSYSNLEPGTIYGGGTANPISNADPPWFGWDR